MRKIIPAILAFLLLVTAAVAQDRPMLGRRGTHRPHWTERRAASGQDKGPGGDFYFGERHQLTVLAEFADQAFSGDEQATIAQWDKILNTVHLNESPFVGSMHDYFNDQSYGLFNLVCDMLYIKVGNRVRYRSTEEDDENSQYLVLDIVDSLVKRDIDWSRYDWNGDGYVNQILIIYAGKGSSYGGFGGGYDAIWPHQWWLSEHIADRASGTYQQPRRINYQGKEYIIDSYCAVQELASDDSYGTFGTLCHEYTHCFGFPDFYNDNMTTTPGYWELMDYGSYNGGGFCPAGYSAHERWLMEWLTPIELEQTAVITNMPALSDDPTAYLIRNDGYESEYYIVENRQNKGWDASLPSSGVLVFHIDYVPEIWLSDDGSAMPNTNTQQHYMIIKANNKASRMNCSGWAYPYRDNNSLTDTSTPAATLWHDNINGTQLMSKPLTGITVTDGLASFEFTNSMTDVEQISLDSRPNAKFLRDGQILIRRGDGIYTLTGQQIR